MTIFSDKQLGIMEENFNRFRELVKQDESVLDDASSQKIGEHCSVAISLLLMCFSAVKYDPNLVAAMLSYAEIPPDILMEVLAIDGEVKMMALDLDSEDGKLLESTLQDIEMNKRAEAYEKN